MRKLKIGIIDLVSKGPTQTLWAKAMHANMASIMPQVIAVWCENQGHEVNYSCYTGLEDLNKEIDHKVDLVFIGSFTQAAQMAYSLSNWYQSKGIVTVLGGPHARCYPEDAQKYFDYVLGLTDQQLIQDVLEDCSSNRPIGKYLSAKSQPTFLPGVRERWKYIDSTLQKASRFIKIVPMVSSMGCPYTCSFCIDSTIPYQPMEQKGIIEDLRFLLTKFKKPTVIWHDPNFGIRFDEIMSVIENAIPPNKIDFIAETSLALLSEPHLKRLKQAGVKGMLPGVESWYEMGNKSKVGKASGIEKVEMVSEHINLILRYLPYVQANFVMGLDSDEGPEPFELTKKFIDKTHGAFPGYSLLTAFGEAAPSNLDYQKNNRVLAFPFHFLNNHMAMNLKPKNYEWPEFYDHVIDVTQHSFSRKAIYRRFRATRHQTSKWMNVVRAISSEGYGRIRFFKELRRLLDEDRSVRDFFEGETTEIPQFYIDRIKNELGYMWEWLPEGALYHDQNAYSKKTEKGKQAQPVIAAT